MRFAANISTMFKDMILLDRFNEAKESGFSAVEAQWVYDFEIPELTEAREAADIPIVLMNSPKRGATWMYDTPPFGQACIPSCEVEFVKSITLAARYCNFLQCPKLHIMAGVIPENATFDQCEAIYLQNLAIAAETLELYKIVGVIEPICREVLPNYFLNSYEQAIRYIEALNLDNIRLLLDVFHLYNIERDVEEGLLRYLPYTAHIQVSQSPKRNEPLVKGDINYENVFKILEDNSYIGDVGLEYTPTGEKPDFEWFKRFGH